MTQDNTTQKNMYQMDIGCNFIFFHRDIKMLVRAYLWS